MNTLKELLLWWEQTGKLETNNDLKDVVRKFKDSILEIQKKSEYLRVVFVFPRCKKLKFANFHWNGEKKYYECYQIIY